MTKPRQQIVLPNPHQGQRTVQLQARRFNVLAAGRRWRKTTLCMVIAVEKALDRETVFWGAPTYDQVRIGFDEMRFGVGAAAAFTLNPMQATFPSGGKVLFRSLDNPDNARGHTADTAILDECGSINPVAWYDVIRPMLMSTMGGAWLGGTPAGRNWFWREFTEAQGRADSMAWQTPTLGVEIHGDQLIRVPHPLENPDISFDEILSLWRTMPEQTFRQEILAEFVEDSGLVFRNVLQLSTLAPGIPQDGHSYIMGIDWGKYNDFTVCTVIDVTAKQQVACDRFNMIDYEIQKGRVRALNQLWQPILIIAEQNSIGDAVMDGLRGDADINIMGFTMSQGSKQALIEDLAFALERKTLTLLDYEPQTQELLAFQSERLPGGAFRYEAPSGMHDDTVIALALAWHGAKGTDWSGMFDPPVVDEEAEFETIMEGLIRGR